LSKSESAAKGAVDEFTIPSSTSDAGDEFQVRNRFGSYDKYTPKMVIKMENQPTQNIYITETRVSVADIGTSEWSDCGETESATIRGRYLLYRGDLPSKYQIFIQI